MIKRVLVLLAALIAVVVGVLVSGSASEPPAWVGAALIVVALVWFTRDRADSTPAEVTQPAPSSQPGRRGDVRVWFPPPPNGELGWVQVVEADGLVVRARVETRNWLLTPPPSTSPNPDHVAPSKHRIILDMTCHGTKDTSLWFRPVVLERQPPTAGDILLTHDTMQLKPEIEVLLDAEPACLRLLNVENTLAAGVEIPVTAGENKRLVLAAVTDYDDVRWQLLLTAQPDDPAGVTAFELRTTAATGWSAYLPDGTQRSHNPNDYDREYTVRLGDGTTAGPPV